MHDLVKITSKSTQPRVITCYFKIPSLSEYVDDDNVTTKPKPGYVFAPKRIDNFINISTSFMFDSD